MNHHQTAKQNALLAFVIIFSVTLIGIYFRPLMIIDETRYVSVAWEMWDKGSFLVPLINGEPYHHKPPLLFWLFHLDWFLFGVNETTIRFIPMLFGLGTLAVLYRLYLALWSDDQEGATYAILVAAGTVIFAFYNSLIMFDVILTFFVLLGAYHIIRATQSPSRYNFMMFSVAFGLAVLTKGPVVLVHLLPLMIFACYFTPHKLSRSFYIKLALAFGGGVLIALAWAVPAGITGGEEYRHAIFFGQTANRMVESFAHQRPLWWYLMLLPLLLFPWSLYKPFYSSLKQIVFDAPLKILTGWLLTTLFFFSLISGKQLHYIMPEIALFSLLFTRVLRTAAPSQMLSAKLIGYSFLLYGAALAVFPFIMPMTKASLTFEQDTAEFLVAVVMIAVNGIYLIRQKFISHNHALRSVALSSVLVVLVTHLPVHNFLAKLDLSNFSQQIAQLQEKGIPVLHDRKYHDQYHFIGRLQQPLIVVNNNEEIAHYAQKDPDTVIVTYERQRKIDWLNQALIIEKTDFKGKYAFLIRAKDYQAFYGTPSEEGTQK
ncbi:MAG: glycosyltransferase family 39 protein [Campylobacterales bacterium]|nr:glycosyltransferase family 39 protein [Campylobacterales bacterium]HEO97964.1 phospholipid carrier-dependent glycosyltransferase [Campylobacterota bacterium]